MLVSDAARLLGMNTQTLRLALQQGLFDFGVAVLTSEKRYTYYINEVRLKAYLEGRNYENKFYNKEGATTDIGGTTNTNYSDISTTGNITTK